MTDFEHATDVQAGADVLFDYLADVSNLPEYFDRMTSAAPAEGEAVRTTALIEPDGEGERKLEGEAWFRVDDGERTVSWGSEGPNDYHGELEVSAAGDTSSVTMRLHTERAEAGSDVDESLRATLANVKHLVEEAGAA